MILNTPDPVLVALIAKLPAVEEGFTTGDRERWIAAMDAALQFLYPPEWTPEARKQARAAAAAGRANQGDVTCEPVTVHLGGSQPSGWDAVDRIKAAEQKRIEQGLADFSRDKEAQISATISRHKEAPSTTSADAVDDESGDGGTPSGAEPAPTTSPPSSTESPAASGPTAPSTSAPTKPSTTDPAPVPPPEPGRKRHFTADQKGAILRRVVREGMPAVQADLLIHESTLNRWVREMPIAVKTFTEEWEAEQQAKALAEGAPTVAELEAEHERPVPPRPAADPPPKSKPVVQWPTAPIEHRPIVDHEAVRRRSAEGV